MPPQFQLRCIDAQDDCLICLTEAMGPSVHLAPNERFNPNQVIHLVSYSPPGNFTDKPNTNFLSQTLLRSFILFSNLKKTFQRPLSHEPRKFQIVKMFSKL